MLDHMKLVAIRDLANVPKIGITVDPKSRGFRHANHIHKGYRFTFGSSDAFDNLTASEKEVVALLVTSNGVVVDDGSQASIAAIAKAEAEIAADIAREKRDKRARQVAWLKSHALQIVAILVTIIIALISWGILLHQHHTDTSAPVSPATQPSTPNR